MNPAKRKKLYRLELQKQNEQKTDIKEEKVIQKEEIVVLQEQVSTASTLDLGLKVTETTDGVDNKKDKKKKLTSQDI